MSEVPTPGIGEAAGLDAGALDDPLVGGFDAVGLDEVVVGDDPRGDVEAGPRDVCLNHALLRRKVGGV
jgi:hypothetical protein